MTYFVSREGRVKDPSDLIINSANYLVKDGDYLVFKYPTIHDSTVCVVQYLNHKLLIVYNDTKWKEYNGINQFQLEYWGNDHDKVLRIIELNEPIAF